MKSIVTRYVAANDETVKAEELKADILVNRTLKVVARSTSRADGSRGCECAEQRKVTRGEVAAETARANSINMAMAIVVVIAIVGSVLFSFIGIARPMTRLNGALGQMAAGNLDIVIPGAVRGDEMATSPRP